jgi:hypothetical protein
MTSLARTQPPPSLAIQASLWQEPSATPDSLLFSEVSIEGADPGEGTLTRRGVVHAKRRLGERRTLAFGETRGMKVSAEKSALYQEIQHCKGEEDALERHLQDRFVPQHGTEQFLSPRAFFVSPLFSVRGKAVPRDKHVELELPTPTGRRAIRYRGPELRQSDGLVFLALLHMTRDVQVGTSVSLQPDAVCKALFGRYDGNSRKQLREHVQRLQQGLIILDNCSVQLCLRFEYPKTGRWTVALDPHIVELFRISPEVWLSIQPRLTLPDGLATWLYAFIESQTKLIPMQLSSLRELCGSEACDKAFSNRFRDALHHLARIGIIDKGWSVGAGQVRWRKTKQGVAQSGARCPYSGLTTANPG